MIGLGEFGHRQGVDVGADADRAVRLPGADRRNDARAADAGRDLVDAEAFEQVEDEANRVLFVEAEFGMLMDMPAPGGHVGFKRFEVNGHGDGPPGAAAKRSEEHTSELQSLMRISYAVFCLKKKKQESNYK